MEAWIWTGSWQDSRNLLRPGTKMAMRCSGWVTPFHAGISIVPSSIRGACARIFRIWPSGLRGAGMIRLKDFGRMAASYSKAFEGGIGDLLAGQSGCREQPISAQGRLERVLQAGPRSFPLEQHYSRAWRVYALGCPISVFMSHWTPGVTTVAGIQS